MWIRGQERCSYNSSKFELFPWSSLIIHFVSWLNSIPPTFTQNPNQWPVPYLSTIMISKEIASGRSVSCGEKMAKSMSVHSSLSICKAEEPTCTMKAFKQAKVCQDGCWQLIFVGYRPRQSLRERHRRLAQTLVTIWWSRTDTVIEIIQLVMEESSTCCLLHKQDWS